MKIENLAISMVGRLFRMTERNTVDMISSHSFKIVMLADCVLDLDKHKYIKHKYAGRVEDPVDMDTYLLEHLPSNSVGNIDLAAQHYPNISPYLRSISNDFRTNHLNIVFSGLLEHWEYISEIILEMNYAEMVIKFPQLFPLIPKDYQTQELELAYKLS